MSRRIILQKRMAGTTRLELAASAVTATNGARKINRLDVRLSATIGFIGHGRTALVQPFVVIIPSGKFKPLP